MSGRAVAAVDTWAAPPAIWHCPARTGGPDRRGSPDAAMTVAGQRRDRSSRMSASVRKLGPSIGSPATRRTRANAACAGHWFCVLPFSAPSKWPLPLQRQQLGEAHDRALSSISEAGRDVCVSKHPTLTQRLTALATWPRRANHAAEACDGSAIVIEVARDGLLDRPVPRPCMPVRKQAASPSAARLVFIGATATKAPAMFPAMRLDAVP
ncbi:hypothetical protein ABIB94_001571 [Bradyrhizobium sp. JR7.2]